MACFARICNDQDRMHGSRHHGSGKSELLISWCLSLAMQYSLMICILCFWISKEDRHSTLWNIFPTPLAMSAILICSTRFAR